MTKYCAKEDQVYDNDRHHHEAADRFDTYRLTDFLALAQRVAEENEDMQICLTIYETKDVSDSELESANTYEIRGSSYSQKTIKPYREDCGFS